MDYTLQEEVNPLIYSYFLGITITAIITISISFELLEEYTLAKSNGNQLFRPVVQTLFGELTILGFIGLIMFSITKVGKDSMDYLACNNENGFFRHEDTSCLDLRGLQNSSTTLLIPQEIIDKGFICLENPLIEITENAHMTLFGVMMLFLLLVVVNLMIGRRQLKTWRTFEDFSVIETIAELRAKESIAKQSSKKSCFYRCPCFCRYMSISCTQMQCCKCCCNAHLMHEHQQAQDRLRYAGLRAVFINSNNEKSKEDDHRLDIFFDFKEYLSQQLSEKLKETIELKITNWIAIYFIFMLFVAISYVLRRVHVEEKHLSITLAFLSIGAMWIVYGQMLCLNQKVKHICSMSNHPGYLENSNPHRVWWVSQKSLFPNIEEGELGETKKENSNHLHAPLLTTRRSHKPKKLMQRRKSYLEPLVSQASSEEIIAVNSISNLNLGSELDFKPKTPKTPSKKSIIRLNPKIKHQKNPSNLDSLLLTDKRNNLCKLVGLANTSDETLCPLYLSLPKRNSMSLHQSLFFNMKNGSALIYSYLTSAQLITALYIGTLVVTFSSPISSFFNTWQMILVNIFAIVPVVGYMLEYSILLPRLVVSTSIHELASSKLTGKTTHIMRSRKALRMLMYSCAIKDAHKLAMKVRTKGLRGDTFSKLSESEQRELEKTCRVKTIPSGQDVLVYGTANSFLYVIICGSAEVIVKGIVVATLYAPQEFGLLSLLNGVPCTATVRSGKGMPLVCYQVDRATYDRYFKDKSKMSLLVAQSEASMNVAVAFCEGSSPQQRHKKSPSELTEDDERVEPRSASSSSSSSSSVSSKILDVVKMSGRVEPQSASSSSSSSSSVSSKMSDVVKMSGVVKMRSNVHQLAQKYRKKHEYHNETGALSFAKQVRKGGRPKEAVEVYRRGALVDLFVMMDSDMGGTVDEEELTNFLVDLFAPTEGEVLSEGEVRQIELMIAGLDEDGDGEVSVTEFLSVMVPIVRQIEEEETPAQITKRMWEVLDVNCSGNVTISEFRDVLAKVGLTMSYDEVRELFSEFDSDGSGALEEDELLAFMKSQI
tara:strand:+ start:58 stop:3210 length:3153 start_codon:yes stop_codon:yes gene_type:complete